MLNNDNLCMLQIKGGHDVLPLTCRAYPRFFNTYGGYEEIGLSFSCPLAAHIIVNNDFNSVYYEDNRGITTYTQVDAERFYLIKRARDELLKIIAENYEDAEKLIKAVLEFSANAQNEIYKKVMINDVNKAKTLKRFFNVETVKNRAINHHTKNVILRPNWKTDLASAKLNNCRIEADTLKIWLNYFIFRYIIKACEDGIFYNRVKGAIISYLVISALDYDFEVAAQKYSKEIEHNEKNLKRLFKFAAKI